MKHPLDYFHETAPQSGNKGLDLTFPDQSFRARICRFNFLYGADQRCSQFREFAMRFSQLRQISS
jgi:hypothetical protein